MTVSKKWRVAIMSTLLMTVLGTVYAWSFFQPLIEAQLGWSHSTVAWAFSASIATLGISAAWGGINLPRYGARRLAVTGAMMYGLGYILAALAIKFINFPLFIVGFGLVGGAGLGLSYVTPVVTASSWFPKKQGLITGMVVMGFGFGALVMSKIIAPFVMNMVEDDLFFALLFIGLIIMFLGVFSASFVRPPQTKPGKMNADAGTRIPDRAIPPGVHLFTKAILSTRFVLMWLIFFINITAGIIFISFQSPLMQDITKDYSPHLSAGQLASIGATLIAISSLFNGGGRFLWGALSDKVGRAETFRIILGSQVLVFIALMLVTNPYIFAVLVCYVLLCYGGGFGTMPSFVLDVFGPRLMPVVYGVVLTAWSAGGIVGAQLVALLKDRYPQEPSNSAFYSFLTGAIMLSGGFIISLFVNNTPLNTEREKRKCLQESDRY